VGSTPRRLGEVLVEMGEVTPEEVERILAAQQQKRVRAARAESALDELSVRDQLLLPESARESVRVDSSQLVRMIALIEQLAGEGSTPLLTELRSLARSCRRDILRAFSARLHRLVHDLATTQDKKVFFSLDGIEETLEPGDMELLFAPLLGLLRNAIEHGLEDASARLESGKDRSGRLSLMALRQGDQVWISVEDDGRGLNRQAILDAAVARGVISRGEAEEMTKRDIVRMLLQQRGAVDGGETERRESGLAAVNRIAQRMNGSIDMFSRPGKGTRITLKLPNAR
jgi:two-component system chemotaxis sensor kinase CheA